MIKFDSICHCTSLSFHFTQAFSVNPISYCPPIKNNIRRTPEQSTNERREKKIHKKLVFRSFSSFFCQNITSNSTIFFFFLCVELRTPRSKTFVMLPKKRKNFIKELKNKKSKHKRIKARKKKNQLVVVEVVVLSFLK